MKTEIYRAETAIPVREFVERFASSASRRGFFIYNESKMEMTRTFTRHGVTVGNGYDLHMIQVCKPDKGANCLVQNPERGVMLPKFVIVFRKDDKTQVRFLRFDRRLISRLIDDEDFPDTLMETYRDIIAAVKEAL